MPVLIDTVAWVCVRNGSILCARPHGKDVFYIPGGKREPGESDLEALLREITEELTVTLVRATIWHAGTYEAHQPSGLSDEMVVRMSCYTGDYSGTLAPAARSTSLPGSPMPTVPRCLPSTSCSSVTSRRQASCANARHHCTSQQALFGLRHTQRRRSGRFPLGTRTAS